ncbi:MAG: CADD family putative folate metabolism protein [Deltaproteobacteria bacterium]|nr:CADD family putative folate metabolism protein [Deltaproteobacteria bacterium]
MHILDQTVSKRHLLQHPFYQRWMEGTLTKPELQRYVENYNPHVEAFPRYVSAVHAQCESKNIRKALLDNLIEEEHGEENHPELWLRFGEALSLDRQQTLTCEKLPAAKKLMDTFLSLTQKSFASGLGALYAYESQVPTIAAQKIKGLKEYYGITTPRGLQFFEVHLQADEYHADSEKTAFEMLDEKQKNEALESVEIATQTLWDFLSALDEAQGIQAACN